MEILIIKNALKNFFPFFNEMSNIAIIHKKTHFRTLES